MLTRSATVKLDIGGISRSLTVTPLFLQNHDQPWQPNEIYEIQEDAHPDLPASTPADLGKLIIDDKMDWHYEGEAGFTEEEVEQIARFVLMEI